MEHLLVTLGKEYYQNETPQLSCESEEARELLNDLEHYPHAFVLGCLMNRGVRAKFIWEIPYKIKQAVGSFEIAELAKLSLEDYERIFVDGKLHRYKYMAKVFYLGVQRIVEEYNGDASKIWKNKSTREAVRAFDDFYGIGQKISNMAVNILYRLFKIPFDLSEIDVAVDSHVRRVMSRLGLVAAGSRKEPYIAKARELYPEFPGVIDYQLWRIGRDYCRKDKPNCAECPMTSACEKQI